LLLLLWLIMLTSLEASPVQADGSWFDSYQLYYSLADGQISPDQNWRCVYTGYGEVKTEAIGSNLVMKLAPLPAASSDITHASLAFTNATFTDQIIELDVRTVEQLRQGTAPNPWEAAWVAFRASNNSFYYFILKPNGIELGKAIDSATLNKQVFLFTADSPRLKIGQWSHWKIQAQGTRISVWIDGIQVVDYVDTQEPRLQSGAVGLYTEDAYVQFDNVRVVPLTANGAVPQITAATVAPFVFSPNGDGIADQADFQFTVSAADRVTLEILDNNGSVVAVPLNAVNLSAGNYAASWNGLSSSGAVAANGMYLFRIRGDVARAVQGSFGINTTIPEVSKSWFLAEGSTVGFSAYVLIQNPNSSPAAVTLTFISQNGSIKTYSETVSAFSRTTVPIHREVPDTFSVSTRIEASLPIIVERAMYFNNNAAGHDSIGLTNLSKKWYFPGNHTFAGDEDFILLTNISSSAAAIVTATFIFEDLGPSTQSYTVQPNSRFTIPVHGIIPGRRVSVVLESTLPIAAEKALYINSRAGGTAGIGAVSPSLTWYFAEGDTSSLTSPGSATTLLEMMNPGDSQAAVTVNYIEEHGSVISRSYIISAKRRLTLDAAREIGQGQRFSIEVLSNTPIVAERLMFSGSDLAGSIGSPTTAQVWNLAEGFTAFGYETWIIISNPGTESAGLSVRFSKQNGENVLQNYTLGAKQRLTLYVNDIIPQTSVSTQVTSNIPVVVERTMKFANRAGIHQSLGVRQ
jgi:hypothetical protein